MPAPKNPFAIVDVAAEEVRTALDYHWDNARRNQPNRLVIQRTISGQGFYRDRHGLRDVPPGYAMIFTHAEDSDYGYCPGRSDPYRLRFVALSPGGIESLFFKVRADFGSVLRMPEESEVAGIFDEIFERYLRKTFRDRFQQSELIYRFLIALYREQVQGRQVDGRRTSDAIEFGYHYLLSHFRSPINLKTVAAKCGISREHFIREFKRKHGFAPGLMLRRLRLDHAKTMLSTAELPVQEVALACGFTSSNSFCRAFRQRFGSKPTEFYHR